MNERCASSYRNVTVLFLCCGGAAPHVTKFNYFLLADEKHSASRSFSERHVAQRLKNAAPQFDLMHFFHFHLNWMLRLTQLKYIALVSAERALSSKIVVWALRFAAKERCASFRPTAATSFLSARRVVLISILAWLLIYVLNVRCASNNLGLSTIFIMNAAPHFILIRLLHSCRQW